MYEAAAKDGYVDPRKVTDILGVVSPEKASPLNIQDNQSVVVTLKQIVRLAAVISAENMKSIAEGYMNIESETVQNIWQENQGKAEPFYRALIHHWMQQTPQNNANVSICI